MGEVRHKRSFQEGSRIKRRKINPEIKRAAALKA
jgi:hypothetical protein